MKLVGVYFVVIFSFGLSAQILGKFEFTGAGICPNPYINVTNQLPNFSFSSFSSQGVNCSSTNDVYNNSGWNTTSVIDLNEFNEFSISANSCYSISLTSLTFSHRISNVTSPPTWHLRSSLDNFSADISNGLSSVTISPITIDISATHSDLKQVVFRLYLTSATANSTTWRNDNVSVSGSVNSIVPTTYFLDADSDSFGDENATVEDCSLPIGYVLNSLDCNDTNSLINPNTSWFLDSDSDGFGDANSKEIGCYIGENYVLDSTDCDDLDPDFTIPVDTFYLDNDSDSFGDFSQFVIACFQPEGYVSNFSDCDDTNPLMFSSAIDINENGIDENCDGVDGYLSVQNNFITIFKIVPNPVKEWFSIESNFHFESISIEVIDVDGKIVLQSEAVLKLNVFSLKNGLYFLKIITESGTYFDRLMIQN